MLRSLVIIILLIFLPSCSSIQEPSTSAAIDNTVTQEADDTEVQSREVVSTYLNLKGKSTNICRVVTLNNVSPDRAVDSITRVIPNLIAVKNAESNMIILRGEEADVKEAVKLIASLDKKVPQILIEGRIVEITENELSNIGFVWGSNQGSYKISKQEDIDVTLNALIASGHARLLANPKIAAIDGKEAEINIGSRVPYAVPAGTTSTSTQWTIQYIDAGVNLKILPNISTNGNIIATIRPEVSNISEWRTTSAGEFPVISTRNASVTVRMRDGETLVIAGLINESERRNMSGIFGLQEIPVIGKVFQKTTTEKIKTDVVFLITPRILF